jgi:hypothetical protein
MRSRRLAWGRAGCETTSCPPFIEEDAQPQEAYQQEVIEKGVVYQGVSLLLRANEDRLPDSQTGRLSARWRYTTGSVSARNGRPLGSTVRLRASDYSSRGGSVRIRLGWGKRCQRRDLQFARTAFPEDHPEPSDGKDDEEK